MFAFSFSAQAILLTRDLPPKHEVIVFLRMTAGQASLYGAISECSSSKGVILAYQRLSTVWTHPCVVEMNWRKRQVEGRAAALDPEEDLVEAPRVRKRSKVATGAPGACGASGGAGVSESAEAEDALEGGEGEGEDGLFEQDATGFEEILRSHAHLFVEDPQLSGKTAIALEIIRAAGENRDKVPALICFTFIVEMRLFDGSLTFQVLSFG